MAEQDDERAAEFENPENLKTAGPGRRVRAKSAAKPLSSHMPIRFDGQMIAEIKRLSDEDGLTVSSWVRRLVQREIDRRQPRPKTVPMPVVMTFEEGFEISAHSVGAQTGVREERQTYV